MCLGTSPNQILDSPVQEQHFNSNEDVHMDDSNPDAFLNTFIFDNMSEHHIQQSTLHTGCQSRSSLNDLFSAQTSSTEVDSFVDCIQYGNPAPFDDTFVDLDGDEPMHNSAEGSHAQTTEYLSDIYTSPTAYSSELPSHGLHQMPSTPTVHCPTPASIPPAAEPDVQFPKTPTKSFRSTRRARKSERGSQNKEKKVYSCSYCGRISTCASNLEEHILTHTKVKDYLCNHVNEKGETCLGRFARPWGLSRHCNDVHKLDVKVTKGGGMRILGPFSGHRSPKKDCTRKTKQPRSNEPVTSNRPVDDASFSYTPPPTIDRIKITTRGPEGSCFCADCELDFFKDIDLIEHNHREHGSPVSSYCSCNLCSAGYYTPETLVNSQPSFSDFLGNGNDEMEVEVPEYDMEIDPVFPTPGVDDSEMMNPCPSSVAQDLSTSTSAKIDTFFTTSSPMSSSFYMDYESDVLNSLQSSPCVGTNSSHWCENDIVTYTSDGFPIHDCPPVSPATFYRRLGLDYNNMTDEERRTYLGGA